MRTSSIGFVVVFLALCALPVTARFFEFDLGRGLHGAVDLGESVALNARSYFDGSFQSAFEKKFDSALGFRAALVRSDNELNYRVFKEFVPSPGTAMVLGKNRFIYERDYVSSYNRRDLVPASELEQKVQRLRRLQDYMSNRHSTLLVVISPNKAAVYPEFLPPRFVDETRVHLTDNYTTFVRLLTAYGVNFLDAQAQMLIEKPVSPFALFASSGAHWNDPAACHVSAQIEDFILLQLKDPPLNLVCEPIVLENVPKGTDRDLADLSNLWFEDELFQPTPYSRPRVLAHGHRDKRPSVLFVGSSFLWQILDYENHYGLQQHDTFFYYYKARVSYPSRKRTPLDQKQIDWQGDVFSKQGIVIEINASVVQHVGWGFLEDADRFVAGG